MGLKRDRLRLGPAAALLLICFVSAAPARPLAEGKTALQAADVIFLGRLVERESFLSDDGRLIWTRHLFAVEDAIHGAGSDTVEVFELGGTVGDVSLKVSHGASYQWGRSYLIIGRRDVEGRLQTWGGPDGRLPILEDGAGRRLARVRAGGLLGSLLEGPAGPLLEWEEIRAKLTAALGTQGGKDR